MCCSIGNKSSYVTFFIRVVFAPEADEIGVFASCFSADETGVFATFSADDSDNDLRDFMFSSNRSLYRRMAKSQLLETPELRFDGSRCCARCFCRFRCCLSCRWSDVVCVFVAVLTRYDVCESLWGAVVEEDGLEH